MFDPDEEDVICDEDCPTENENPGHQVHHGATWALLNEAMFQTYLFHKCVDFCVDVHGVLASANFAAAGMNDEGTYEFLDLPWLGERP